MSSASAFASITFSIEDFRPYNNTRDEYGYLPMHPGYKPDDLEIIREYFGTRSTVTIPVIPVAVNGGFGGYTLSDEALRIIAAKKLRRFEDVSSRKLSRTDPDVIETIRMIGSERASGMCSSIELEGFPANYTECLSLSDYDGIDMVRFDTNQFVKKLLVDKSISDKELREKLIELSFISIVFDKIKKHIKLDREPDDRPRRR